MAGAVSDKRWTSFERVRTEITEITKLLKTVKLSPQVGTSARHVIWMIDLFLLQGWTAHGFTVQHDGVLRRSVYSKLMLTFHRLTCHFSAFELLRYPTINTSDLICAIPELSDADPQILARIDIDG